MAEDPIGGVVRNLVALQRLATGTARETNTLLRALFDDISAEIARIDPGSEVAASRRLQRLRALMEEVEGLSDERFQQVLGHISTRLEAIGVQQGAWAEEQLARSLGEEAARVGIAVNTGAVAPEFARSIAVNDPWEGKVLAEWVDTQQAATIRRVREQVQVGMARAETLGDIVRRVRGTRRGDRFVGGILETTTRETEAIIRTSINHVSNRAHAEVYRQNSDVVAEEEFVAVLDSRTTAICAAHDGQTWPVGEVPSNDRPPLHYGCRSIVTPVIDYDGLGLEDPTEGSRPAKTYDVDDGELRETGAKQVSGRTDYEAWFRDQPPEVQDEIIGPTRARLLRQNKISFRDMITRDNRVVDVTDLPGGEDALKAVRSSRGQDGE